MDEFEFEELHKKYRRAMRVGDRVAALEAVRHLAEADDSQDWTEEVEAAEERVWRGLTEDFMSALAAGREADAARLAAKVRDGDWSREPFGDSVVRLVEWHETWLSARRLEKAIDRLAVLKANDGGTWVPADAAAALADLDALAAEGWTPSPDESGLLEKCRLRVKADEAAARQEAAYAEACRKLADHTARRNVQGIEETLRLPILLDRPAPDDLMKKARLVLVADQTVRARRKVTVLVTIVLISLALCGGGGLFGYVWWRNQQAKAADKEAARAESRKAEEEKKRKQAEEEQRENAERLAEFAQITNRLTVLSMSGWSEAEIIRTDGDITRGLELARSDAEKLEVTKLGDSFKKRRPELVEEARKEAKVGLDDLAREAERLKEAAVTSWPSPRLESEIGEKEAMLKEWTERYLTLFPDMQTESMSVTGCLSMARESKRRFEQTVKKVETTDKPSDLLDERRSLIRTYAKCEVVKAMGDDMPSDDSVYRFMDAKNKTPGQKFYESMVADEDWDGAGPYRVKPAVLKMLKELSGLSGRYVGKLEFSQASETGYRKASVKTVAGATLDTSAPIYLLKETDQKPYLVKVAEFKDGAWRIVPGAVTRKDWQAPLFQAATAEGTLDIVERSVRALKEEGVPEEMWPQTMGKIPFVDWSQLTK